MVVANRMDMLWQCLLLTLCAEAASHQVHKSALLVVDMQACLLPGGPVAVSGDIGPLISAINGLKDDGNFDVVVWTQDWHPPNHISFAPVHGKSPQDTLQLSYTCVGKRWLGKGPRLCNMTQLYPSPEQSVTCRTRQDESSCDDGEADSTAIGNSHSSSAADSTDSMQSDPALESTHVASTPAHVLTSAAAGLAERIRAFGCPEPATQVEQVLWPPHCVQQTAGARLHPDLHVSPEDLLVRKGWQPFLDAYSAFEDNGKLQSTGLAELLKQQGVQRVVVAGVALDFCVLWTALDARAEGFETILALDATLPVSSAGAVDAVRQLQQAGVTVVKDWRSLLDRHMTATS